MIERWVEGRSRPFWINHFCVWFEEGRERPRNVTFGRF